MLTTPKQVNVCWEAMDDDASGDDDDDDDDDDNDYTYVTPTLG